MSDSTTSENDFTVPAEPGVIDGDEGDDPAADIGVQPDPPGIPANSDMEGWK